MRLPHPVAEEPLQAVGIYTPSPDTPALNDSSRRWTGSLPQSHTCGRDTKNDKVIQVISITSFGITTAAVGSNVHFSSQWESFEWNKETAHHFDTLAPLLEMGS